jgi:putative FmdB family regulatory protein
MPIYEYQCSKCGCKFELLRSINQANGEVSCPQCHNTAERIMSAFVSKSTDDIGFTKNLGGSSCSGCSSSSCTTCGG